MEINKTMVRLNFCNRFSIIVICLFLLTACINTHSGEATMYRWIETMTSCPTPDKNRYPNPDKEAVALYKQAIEARNARPQTLKPEQILALIQQAATKGYWPAMHNLAVSYYEGYGVEESPEKALYWFKEIEKLDIPEGYTDMMMVYDEGIGVAADPDKSRDYMIKAAKAGDPDSQFYLGLHLYDHQDQSLAFEGYALKLLQCAAEHGHKQAHFHLALHYEVTKQLPMAYRFYLRGAKAGDVSCLRTLANAYGQINAKHLTFNLQKDKSRAICLENLSEKVDDNTDLTFPDLDTLCPGTVPQPNEMK